MKERVVGTIGFMLLIFFASAFFLPSTKVSARTIQGNGTEGIYIDIDGYPYNTLNYSNIAYSELGCTWFVSSRLTELTGTVHTIYGGSNWYNSKYANYGYSRGTTLSKTKRAIACWSNHVCLIEKVNGNVITITEGGYSLGNNSTGYTRIANVSSSYFASDLYRGTFLGYVYTNSGISIGGVPAAVTNLRSSKTVYNSKESITFTWDPSYGTQNYWVYLWKNGKELYGHDCGTNTTFTSAPTSPGNYTLVIRSGNINGFNDSSKSYSFIVTDSVPAAVTNLRSSKTVYNSKESITFTWNPSYGTQNYWVYLWKNGKELYGHDCGTNTTFTSAPTSPGNYTLVIRPGNINGFNDSSKSYSFIVTDSNVKKDETSSAQLTNSTSEESTTIEKNSFTRISTIKVNKKSIKIKWKKVKKAKGYQIQYATNKKLKKKKAKLTKKNETTINKVKKGKTYYFRVRAYIFNGKKRVYAKWSKVKKVKTGK